RGGGARGAAPRDVRRPGRPRQDRGRGPATLPRRSAGHRHMTRLWDVTLHAVILMTAAFVMALAFPRTDWSLTPWVALAPLLAIATIRAPRTAFFWGWRSEERRVGKGCESRGVTEP